MYTFWIGQGQIAIYERYLRIESYLEWKLCTFGKLHITYYKHRILIWKCSFYVHILQMKEKEKREDKPPFLDFSCLRSKTLQILLLSTAFTSFGINTPLFNLVRFIPSIPPMFFNIIIRLLNLLDEFWTSILCNHLNMPQLHLY